MTELEQLAKVLRQHRLTEYGPSMYRCSCEYNATGWPRKWTLRQIRAAQSEHTARVILDLRARA